MRPMTQCEQCGVTLKIEPHQTIEIAVCVECAEAIIIKHCPLVTYEVDGQFQTESLRNQ